MRILIIIISLFCIHPHTHAQEVNDASTPSENALYGSVGYGLLYATLNINYERYLATSGRNDNLNFYARGAIGVWALWADSGPSYLLGLNSIWSRYNNHLEAMVGAVAMFDRSGYRIGVSNAKYASPGYTEPTRLGYTLFTPAAGVGYRFQRPGGSFIFRTGVGWPEALYLSVGFAW